MVPLVKCLLHENKICFFPSSHIKNLGTVVSVSVILALGKWENLVL